MGRDVRRLPLYLGLFILSGVLEVVGLGLVAPFLAVSVGSGSEMVERITEVLPVIARVLDGENVTVVTGVALVSVMFLKGVLAIAINYSIISFSAFRQAKLKIFLMRSYQQLDYVEFSERNSAEYIQTVQSLTAIYTNNALLPGLRFVSDAVVAIGIIGALLFVEWRAVLVLAVVAISGAVLYDRIFRYRLLSYGEQLTEAAEQVTQGIQEGLNGLKEIRLLSKEDFFAQMVNDGAIKSAKIGVHKGLISGSFRYVLELFIILFLVLFVFALEWSDLDSGLKMAVLATFGVAGIRLGPVLNSMVQAGIEVRSSEYPVKRLFDDLNQIQNSALSASTAKIENPEQELFRELAIKNVKFAYKNPYKGVLKDINLSVKSGEAIGIMGRSGVGKSTLLDILLGLLQPDKGEITINGKNLQGPSNGWGSRLAYIPQETFLLDGTIAMNVTLTRSELTEELLDSINVPIQKACLAEFIDGLPDGLNTRVGEKGAKLSGGQRQRVSLARALYHQRNILVLDEATSSLDRETEKQIIEEIQKLKGSITLIVVAHRESTLSGCDRIYELADGELKERISFRRE